MTDTLAPVVAGTSLINFMGAKYGLEPTKFLGTLINTVFPANSNPSNEQVAAFLVVAKEYDLNPFIKEIYAFPAKGGGIVPIVSIDGWVTLINRQPMLDGLEFEDSFDDNGKLSAITTVIYRKDRSHPTRITEYMSECKRNTGPWESHPARMLRHKSLIQTGRVAFGLAGIYDQDEGERIAEAESPGTGYQASPPEPIQTKSEKLAAQLKNAKADTIQAEVAQPSSEPIEVCGSCGVTEVPLTDVEGIMLCDSCKPKPVVPAVAQPAPPTQEAAKAAPAAQSSAPAAQPPWARPKSVATQPAVEPVKTENPSLQEKVAEMAAAKAQSAPAKVRIKPKNPIIKKVRMPEFADRATEEDAWTQEQYNRAVTAFKNIPTGAGNKAEGEEEGQLRSTVLGWIGLPIDEINAATLEVLIGILSTFGNPEGMKAWAEPLGIWTGA